MQSKEDNRTLSYHLPRHVNLGFPVILSDDINLFIDDEAPHHNDREDDA